MFYNIFTSSLIDYIDNCELPFILDELDIIYFFIGYVFLNTLKPHVSENLIS